MPLVRGWSADTFKQTPGPARGDKGANSHVSSRTAHLDGLELAVGSLNSIATFAA